MSAAIPPKRSDAVSLGVVLVHVVVVIGPVWVAAYVGPGVVSLICVVWVGVLMHGLLNLMHESAHYHTFKPRWASDALGHWLLGPLMLTDFAGYRDRHWVHHRKLGTDDDTKDAYLIDIRGWRIVGLLARCLLLGLALAKVRAQATSAAVAAAPASRMWLVRTAAVQLLLAGSLLLAALRAGRSTSDAVIAALVAYAFVYGYGLAALTPFVATLRAIAEHQRSDDDAVVEGRAALRNFTCGPVARLVMGSYGFAEHATHHREPAIPSYHLQHATAGLDDPALAPHRGYFATLRRLMTSTGT